MSGRIFALTPDAGNACVLTSQEPKNSLWELVCRKDSRLNAKPTFPPHPPSCSVAADGSLTGCAPLTKSYAPQIRAPCVFVLLVLHPTRQLFDQHAARACARHCRHKMLIVKVQILIRESSFTVILSAPRRHFAGFVFVQTTQQQTTNDSQTAWRGRSSSAASM